LRSHLLPITPLGPALCVYVPSKSAQHCYIFIFRNIADSTSNRTNENTIFIIFFKIKHNCIVTRTGVYVLHVRRARAPAMCTGGFARRRVHEPYCSRKLTVFVYRRWHTNVPDSFFWYPRENVPSARQHFSNPDGFPLRSPHTRGRRYIWKGRVIRD
jgi:hypothetical protein